MKTTKKLTNSIPHNLTGIMIDDSIYTSSPMRKLHKVAGGDAPMLYLTIASRFCNTEGCLAKIECDRNGNRYLVGYTINITDDKVLIDDELVEYLKAEGYAEETITRAIPVMIREDINLIYRGDDGMWALTGMMFDENNAYLSLENPIIF